MTSNIEWTDETWNPVVGCTRASRGCDHCYAVTMTHRLEKIGQARYAGLTVLNGRGERHFNGVVRTVPEALGKPLRWRKPRRVFVNSMSDLFHPDVPFEYIDRVFAVMALCPQHTFQVLTKRPERMAEYLLGRDGETKRRRDEVWGRVHGMPRSREVVERGDVWPLPNVWLGTSVEDQAAAEARIPHLLRCPAAVRFLSCEPLVGAVDLGRVRTTITTRAGEQSREWRHVDPKRKAPHGVDWVIAGGESGPGARPCDLAWIQGIVGQCRQAGVACFVKQLGADPVSDFDTWNDGDRTEGQLEGEVMHWKLHDRKGGDFSEFPDWLRVREWPDVASPARQTAHG